MPDCTSWYRVARRLDQRGRAAETKLDAERGCGCAITRARFSERQLAKRAQLAT
jgi:hypothetical protein